MAIIKKLRLGIRRGKKLMNPNSIDVHQQELGNNYKAFINLLPRFPHEQTGKHALLRHGQLVNVFDSPNDALIYAQAQYRDGLYSVQQITNAIVDLGNFDVNKKMERSP